MNYSLQISVQRFCLDSIRLIDADEAVMVFFQSEIGQKYFAGQNFITVTDFKTVGLRRRIPV